MYLSAVKVPAEVVIKRVVRPKKTGWRGGVSPGAHDGGGRGVAAKGS